MEEVHRPVMVAIFMVWVKKMAIHMNVVLKVKIVRILVYIIFVHNYGKGVLEYFLKVYEFITINKNID
jgi:hypothetical protein